MIAHDQPDPTRSSSLPSAAAQHITRPRGRHSGPSPVTEYLTGTGKPSRAAPPLAVDSSLQSRAASSGQRRQRQRKPHRRKRTRRLCRIRQTRNENAAEIRLPRKRRGSRIAEILAAAGHLAARAESRPVRTCLRHFPYLLPIRYRIVHLILLRLDYPSRAGTPGSGAIAPSDGLQDWYVHMYVNDLPGTGRGELGASFIWLGLMSFVSAGLPDLSRPGGRGGRRGGYGEVGRPPGARRGARPGGGAYARRSARKAGRRARRRRKGARKWAGADGIRPITIRSISGGNWRKKPREKAGNSLTGPGMPR